MWSSWLDKGKIFEMLAKISIPIKRKQPVLKSTIVNNKHINYLLNDPTTPELIKKINQPEHYSYLKYYVHGYIGGGYEYATPEGRAANVYATVTNSLNEFLKHAPAPLTKWAGTNALIIVPDAGEQLNAFYNRKGLCFFHGYDKVEKKMIYTADSSEIVAHELGHAILDSYRPDTWGSPSLEVWSFHEAFADLTAILSIMQHDEVLIHALKENKGKMNNHSVISSLAENMGIAIYNLTGGAGGRPRRYLRTAINDFKYTNPGSLPQHAPHNKLAAECHSFGRVFLGAFYDILTMMYDDGLSQGMDQITALKHARDVLSKYVLKAIKFAPNTARFYESMAKTILWVDWSLPNKPYHDRMKNIFLNRNLMRREVKMLNAPPVDKNKDGIVALGKPKSIKLSDHIIKAQSQQNNPLYDVEIEIVEQNAYWYDENNNIIDSMQVSFEETLGAAQDMIIYLHETGSVSDDENTPFEISDGKLKRTHFS